MSVGDIGVVGLPSGFNEVFKVEKPIIGMVHLPPLPGSPRYEGMSIEEIVERAIGEAAKLAEGGVDGLLVENYNDNPYIAVPKDPFLAAMMAVVVREIRREVNIPVGVNVLRNGALLALPAAKAAGGKFIRVNVFTDTVVTDQGIIEPCAAELQRSRKILCAEDVLIFADIHVKYSRPLVELSIEEEAKNAAFRGGADALILTGRRTGEEASLEELLAVKKAVPKVPVLLGSGVTAENVEEFLKVADGAIVGTYFKEGGITEAAVDVSRVKRFMEKVRRLRRATV